MFKTMGYSPQAFCSKTVKFRLLPIHRKSKQTVAQGVTNHLIGVSEAFQRVWSDFQELPKSAMFKTMGYSSGFFSQNRPNFDPCQFTRNWHKQSRKVLEIILERFRKRFREFGAISRNCQNPPCSKPWAIAQAFCSKTANFDPCQFTRNWHKQSRNVLEIVLERFRKRFRDFGSISRTCENPPCSKPWAIAEAFCSKSANFRPLPIHPKSTQTVAQGVRNNFRKV